MTLRRIDALLADRRVIPAETVDARSIRASPQPSPRSPTRMSRMESSSRTCAPDFSGRASY
jgi:hypothetical protein